MDKTDIWMPMFWRDYFADTLGFTAAEHGAYLCLIGHYWMNGGPIPYDQKSLMRVANLSGRGGVRVLNCVLRKFQLGEFVLSHKRIDEELAKAAVNKAKSVKKASIAAKARWSKDAPSNASSNACSMPQAMLEGMLEQCPSPSPSSSTSKVITNTPPIDNPPKPEKKKKNIISIKDLSLPPNLDTEIGRAALESWLEYKRERGESYKTTRGLNALVNSFKHLTDRDLERAVEFSMGSNYQGVFPPRSSGNNTQFKQQTITEKTKETINRRLMEANKGYDTDRNDSTIEVPFKILG